MNQANYQIKKSKTIKNLYKMIQWTKFKKLISIMKILIFKMNFKIITGKILKLLTIIFIYQKIKEWIKFRSEAIKKFILNLNFKFVIYLIKEYKKMKKNKI
jgi:hypothetical protein